MPPADRQTNVFLILGWVGFGFLVGLGFFLVFVIPLIFYSAYTCFSHGSHVGISQAARVNCLVSGNVSWVCTGAVLHQ